MAPFRNTVSALAVVAIGSVNAAFGPAFSTGPTSNSSFIREASSTLLLPKVPSGSSGDLSLWVGMGTSNGDLIQSIADNYDSSYWSIFAYTLVSTSATTQTPVEGKNATAYANDAVTMHYKYNDATGNYTQTVLVNGKVVSTLSTSDGKAEGWGSAVECAETNCGTVGAHSWTNTTIILDVADPDYIDTMGKGDGVTGDMSTSDGGKTWEVGTIHIPEYTFESS